jgi:hypothetical protein
MMCRLSMPGRRRSLMWWGCCQRLYRGRHPPHQPTEVAVVVALLKGGCTWQAWAGSTWSTNPPAYTGSPGCWHGPHTWQLGQQRLQWSGEEEGQGAVGPAICAAGVPAAEMACRVDLGTSILEGSKVLANWAIDIGGVAGGGGSNKVGAAEDVCSAITGSRGSGGAIPSAWGREQQQSPKPPPLLLPVSRASLARDAIARLSLPSLLSSLVGVSNLNIN